jgi:ribosome-associated translation inhibitor RaiA
MIEQIVFRGCGARLREGVRAYWARKRWRISRLLTTFRHELCDLQLTAKRDADMFRFQGVLKLPTDTLVAEGLAETWCEAMDQMVDRLTAEVRRHRERLRHDDIYKRKNRRGAGVMRWRPQLALPDVLVRHTAVQGRKGP